MTVHELHDAIGLLDEELLEQTDRLRTTPRKRMTPRRYWAAAACLGMVLCGTLAYWFVNNALRCGSAAPAQFIAKSAPMENAAAAQRSAEDSAIPESPAANSAKMECAEDAAAPASGAADTDRGELSTPPALSIADLAVTSGNYTWTVHLDDGSAQTIAACGVAPTDSIEKLPTLNAQAQDIALEWTVPPILATARCWQVGQDTEQEAAFDGGILTLRPGDWVYEVHAEFDQGEALYAFRGVWE